MVTAQSEQRIFDPPNKWRLLTDSARQCFRESIRSKLTAVACGRSDELAETPTRAQDPKSPLGSLCPNS